ncbi:peroxisomal membrane anchor protein conserved region-domain-containing protein [Xylaria bambusicola]|uniref:peroxisomal membrane anchor protein conserved region-domain-containing protein n=1 Tax=Xylaria bambusicola TaxID=326684 RepID=UPI0020085A51|nr:peroxisomal membrane anchor protein conserved region-domain-containing protein [Xylaria bambusicola]KAI0518528.1 peroxisomal membrane anchor protein conserved region-domain-containing protein [Xylaria bambusicola]
MDDDSNKPAIPAWQQANAEADATSEPEHATIEHARRFLDDETVKAASLEDKRTFLKSKGFEHSQIDQLLNESADESTPSSAIEPVATTGDADVTVDVSSTVADSPSSTVSSFSNDSPSPVASFTGDTPPIITYPEFLTKPQRPPPLITPSRLANILAVSGGIWALIYGLAGLVVKPMAENLNEARSEYYHHVNGKLSQLVEKLEGAVSEVPYKNGRPLRSQKQGRDMEDNESVTSDPTELFHRDVGTQTSPPPSLYESSASSEEKPVDSEAKQLSRIRVALRDLTLMHTQRAESIADVRSEVGQVRDQVDKLAYPPIQDLSTYGGLSYGQSTEANDEFKKTKDAIRSIKGLFLSSRSFPAVTTR